ncbi:chromosome segregation and condensation protein ScpA [Xylanimonas cellulosilytica DSM 15894]|uniref:Segregation and condensation protein A n=1 Tax=Xylanimonas cellulosilytica (strain DSM 15894 / JCM 12276 / CECT 5975 / KCTC 9989 / LMG 20990 / NBRC 107835 / XIL07) TaxID=446471 RepID=D1BSA0_XYLCX|nr:ScpA family protein [Xylanimonas cellulosilytica]ACZ30592.1 chromosome segregation and condensation protein ScpA [Xylanimonas cellulosilytica DSM 15894]
MQRRPRADDAGSPPQRDRSSFEVHLDNFTGPFDVLLSLIAKHELDVTEVALAVVTDEFVAYTRAHPEWDLDTASEFLVIAATLLDLKAARLLPGLVEEDLEDLELLEARDLLFARLLQYRAYKQVSAVLAERLATEGRRVPRSVPLEPSQAALLPELVWTLTPDRFAELAARALTPKAPPVVSLTHLHAPAVSVREQAAIVVGRLRREHTVTFRSLVAGEERLVAVARFLALLELFRGGQVAFEQAEALAELTIRWTGDDSPGAADGLDDLGFEEFDGAPQVENDPTVQANATQEVEA